MFFVYDDSFSLITFLPPFSDQSANTKAKRPSIATSYWHHVDFHVLYSFVTTLYPKFDNQGLSSESGFDCAPL